MTREVAERKLSRLLQRLAKLHRLAPPTLEAFLADEAACDRCGYALIVTVEECSDLAEHIISERGWEAPGTVADEFRILAARGLIPAVLAEELRQAVGMRNLLVHEYAEIQWGKVYAAATDLSRFERFVDSMRAALGI